ncbi:putative PEP-binding protein [Nonomuraea lactucae]|uniref:putative PEP-binding protein n=1 Tax=Nonomuraea lactucae TaxID=2249762 RepID=UPI000DE41EDC|nr:putative PEP-binding protein [Nonomuraea lactucae]
MPRDHAEVLPMRRRLSLSGEIPPASVVAKFDGIGLIRSEYVLRAEGHFITTAHAQRVLADYLTTVMAVCPEAPVWYRTSEMTSQEANTLVEVDARYQEADFMKGRRGIRRALELPGAFETELRVVAEVARDHPNLHLLTPFVRDAADFGFAVDMLDKVGWPNRFGSMVEIPSLLLDLPDLLAMGASNLMLGLNDLSSLLTGTSREFTAMDMKTHPSVWWTVGRVREQVGMACEWGVAGNLSKAVLERAERAGVPYASEHYSELPALRGLDPDDLPDLDFVSRTKAFTREQIALDQKRAWRSRLSESASGVTG